MVDRFDVSHYPGNPSDDRGYDSDDKSKWVEKHCEDDAEDRKQELHVIA